MVTDSSPRLADATDTTKRAGRAARKHVQQQLIRKRGQHVVDLVKKVAFLNTPGSKETRKRRLGARGARCRARRSARRDALPYPPKILGSSGMCGYVERWRRSHDTP